jgi:hypothetical protein
VNAAIELYARVARAWELRGKPGYNDALAVVLDAWDRAPLTYFEACEERQARNEWLIGVLRETDPSTVTA